MNQIREHDRVVLTADLAAEKSAAGDVGIAMHVYKTLCAFANGGGGRVIIGVKPDWQLVGQQVSEQTFHEIAAARDRFEPPIVDNTTRKMTQERYDATYLELAMRLRLPFACRDGPLKAILPKAGVALA